MDGKYPKHKMKSSGSGDYKGSGSLNDRVRTPKDEFGKRLPAKGGEKMHMEAGDRTHMSRDMHPDKRVESAPGFTSPKAMKMGTTHGWRAHERQHSNVVKDRDTELRFSGNDGAHRVGAKCKGFGKSAYHIQGLKGEKTPAMVKPMGKSTSKASTRHKAQPKTGSGDRKFPGSRSAGKS